jgi:hypothetical protein
MKHEGMKEKQKFIFTVVVAVAVVTPSIRIRKHHIVSERRRPHKA